MTKVIPAIRRAPNCAVAAIAFGDADRVIVAASRLGIPTAYDSYEELLNYAGVDVVSIPLPNDLHAEWTIRAAAGKHMLCEKPPALSATQAGEMVRACEDAGAKLGEAFTYRHHPSWLETACFVRDGAIGELPAVRNRFSRYDDDPDDIRNRLENGGGAIMGVGCYNINLPGCCATWNRRGS